MNYRPGVIVIVIITITFFTVIVIENLILKVIVIVIVDKVIVIYYYFAITFYQTHNTFCQICHYTIKSHCHLIGCFSGMAVKHLVPMVTGSIPARGRNFSRD